jgi:DnaJ family protein C protein 28
MADNGKEQEQDESLAHRRRQLPPSQWESAVEKQIREAMERGDFDNLPGRGKPLDLSRDPNVPDDWEMAVKLLKDAGYAPQWIEEDKEIRAWRERLFAPLARYLQRPPADRSDRAVREARVIADFRKGADELNRAIDLFNLKAPTPRLHHRRVRVEEEAERFQAECKKRCL